MIHGVRTVRPDLHFENGVRAVTSHSFNSNTNRSQVFGKATVIDGNVDVLAYPLR
jgi:hypothetical protein